MSTDDKKGIQSLLGSASGLERTMACPASNLMAAPEMTSSPAAERGKRLHLWAENVAAGRENPDEHLTEDEKLLVGGIAPEQLAGSSPGSLIENAFAVDLDYGTGIRLNVAAHRDYELSHELQVPGTADVVVQGFGVLEVWDYKFGAKPVKATANLQLTHLAVAAYLALKSKARSFLLGIQQPDKHGHLVSSSVIVDAESTVNQHMRLLSDTAVVALRTKKVIDSGGVPDVNPGSHCWFCPSRLVCPAKGK